MPHISVKCPHCSSPNEIYASEAPAPPEILCSSCRAPIGAWKNLEQQELPARDTDTGDLIVRS